MWGLAVAFFLASLGDLGWGANVARQKAAETPHGMQAFSLAQSRFALVQPAIPQMPLTVVGPRGALLGQQNGVFESWIFPDKIFSDFRISARLKDYPVPIDVNRLASVVDVEPDHTTITYSHAAFTVRQIMFAPRHAANGTGVVVLFQVDSVRPLQLTFSFTPEVKRAWPAPNYGPSPEWVKSGDGGGHYILHTDSAGLAAGLEMPGAHPGILAPYQERPHSYPLQFVLDFDPGTDRGLYFPLLMAVGNSAAMATNASLEADLQVLGRNLAQIYRDTASYHSDFFDRRLTIETPDPKLDLAYRWALIAMDDDRIRLYTDGEMGLAAGFYPSGDSARPGFGWFFGRDALWTVYALDAEGDFSTAREAMQFLLNRQRPDGKVMHEYAQTAETVDWKSLPYEYAAADATPLLLMAAADYVNASDDIQFLRDHWPQFQKAWQYETGHDSRDGIYNNSNGTGWVESWPGGMPQQEIYLAALDVQASTAMGRLAAAEGDEAIMKQARTRAARIGATVPKEYALDSGFYAFSRNANGSLDKTATIYPTVAWWDGTYSLPKADVMFSRWASKEFSTDWGTRDISEVTPFYDPISYHQGSVWPLFTGWTSLAEYRTGRTLSGYAHLMQNANLTFAQDLGAVTELLSGAFYQTLGRSTSHQLWSSAMVVSPLLRGMFGLQWDAAAKTLYVTPHLPPCWDHATLHHVSLGQSSFDLDFRRDLGQMDIAARGDMHGIRLASHATGAQVGDKGDSLRIPLPPVEVQIPSSLPEPGSRTSMVKVLAETWGQHSLRLLLEGQGGSTISMPLRRNGMGGKIAVHGGVLKNNSTGQLLWVQFPDGVGYQQRQLDVAW
jgi:hypothetical protein